jgi:alkanesulfonate monooxygenase SsuD/methylene tetrahydromethanopterin reductase-like flavin-dependent oxidoreductase (luciferase family)
MAPFITRFDLRAPDFGAAAVDLYDAAINMAVFAEANDFQSIAVSEHHASSDGYLPSPIVFASAVAARTSTIPIMIAALLAPLYDPIHLAEDMAVLDLISHGRVVYVFGIGYRPSEYESFGLNYKTRGKTIEANVGTLRAAWTGEPFEFAGRTVTVRPTPHTPGGPLTFYGGGTVAAARRAGRLDMPFLPQHGGPELEIAYQETRAELGLPPGMAMIPGDAPLNVFVAQDPDAMWAKIGENLLHDSRMYADWQIEAGMTSVALALATTVDELRAGSVYRIVTPDECVELARTYGTVSLHPLCGGIDPAVGWEMLELVGNTVIPAFDASQAGGA